VIWKSHRDCLSFLGVILIETIGSRIRLIRKLNKINQVGISQATLSEMEQDKYKPSVDTIIAIAAEFGSDVKWILLGAEGSKEKAFEVNVVNEQEAHLLQLFDKLKEMDKEEIVEIIKL
jgi:transcriptional regulator with XRE-family HTH domain